MEGIESAVVNLKGFFERVNEASDEIAKMAREELEKELDVAKKEFSKYYEEAIREIFNDAVEVFYDAYPDNGRRTYGLFDILNIEYGADGVPIAGIDDSPLFMSSLDRSKMHKNRSGGDNLFDLVFMEGYHGGAPYISPKKAKIWGAHPNPGTPYYRRSGVVKYSDDSEPIIHPYGAWGRPAAHSTPPYEIFSTNLLKAYNGRIRNKFKELGDEHADIAHKRVGENIPDILKRIVYID